MKSLSLALGMVVSTLLFACRETSDTGIAGRTRIFDLVSATQYSDLRRRPVADPVRFDLDPGTIFVPDGQRLNLFFELAGAKTLRVDQLQHRGDGTYRISFRGAGGEDLELAKIASSSNSLQIELPEQPAIAMLAIGSAPTAAGSGGLLLVRPRIESSPEKVPSVVPNTVAASIPDIVIYLVDTLRRDRLGIYGSDLSVSPNIDAFAGTSTTYDNAVAQSTWTRPAVASVLTGLEPHLHGTNRRADSLPSEVLTLAEILGDRGYETAAFITNGNISEEFNFNQGFGFFSRSESQRYHADQLNERVFAFLESRSGSPRQPLFLFIHAVDPHAPYAPGEPFKSRFASDVEDPDLGEIEFLNGFHKRQEIPDAALIDKVLALYNGEIAFMDEHFGRLLNELKGRDLFDDSLIMFVSDHGEEFWEHGDWSHGHTLYGELLDIPLIIKAPRQRLPSRSANLVQQIDLFATALDWAGVESSFFARGHSQRRPYNDAISAYSMIDVDGRIGVAIVHEGWKLIVPRTGNMGVRPRLLNRILDPTETHDYWADRPVVAGYLMTLLRRHEAPSDFGFASEQVEVSAELKRELEALGYLD